MSKNPYGMNSGTSYWHCNYCGKGGQDISRTTCEECGKELLIFGTVEEGKEAAESLPRPDATVPDAPKSSGKNKKVIIALSAVAGSFVMLAVVCVAFFGVIVSFFDGPEPVSATSEHVSSFEPVTQAETAVAEKSDAVLADFESFANGHATLVSTVNDDGIIEEYYTVSPEKAKCIFSEYIKLLENDYKFELMHERHSGILNWYGYVYTGNEDVSGITTTFADSEIYEDHNISIYIVDESEHGDGSGISVSYNEELETEINGKITSYSDSTVYYPSFTVFSGADECEEYEYQGTNLYKHVIPLKTPSGDYTDVVVNQYIDLIYDCYPMLEYAGEHQLDGDYWSEWFWFEYAGDASVTSFDGTIADGTVMENYVLAVFAYQDGSSVVVEVYESPDLQQIDVGEVFVEY